MATIHLYHTNGDFEAVPVTGNDPDPYDVIQTVESRKRQGQSFFYFESIGPLFSQAKRYKYKDGKWQKRLFSFTHECRNCKWPITVTSNSQLDVYLCCPSCGYETEYHVKDEEGD